MSVEENISIFIKMESGLYSLWRDRECVCILRCDGGRIRRGE